MFPTITSGSVSPQVNNVLMMYRNPNYIAQDVMATVPGLVHENGKIPQMGNAHLRIYTSKRALYDTSDHRLNWTINNDATYQIDYYDLDSYIPDRLQQQLQAPFDAQVAAGKTVMEALMLERENALAAQLTSTSVLTNNTTLSGTSQYTDQTNSTPEVDFDTARDSIQSKTGFEANMMIMSRKVANALRRHPWFMEIAKSALSGGMPKAGALSPQALVETLKAWYGLDYVLIGNAIKVTSQEGQTETKGSVWGNDVVFAYRAPSASLFAPSFGYSFQLEGQNMRTVIRRHASDKGDVVEVMWAYQDAIIDTNCAYLIKDAVA